MTQLQQRLDNDRMSSKGLKCSTNEHENVENTLIINGGSFIFDTNDNAIIFRL